MHIRSLYHVRRKISYERKTAVTSEVEVVKIRKKNVTRVLLVYMLLRYYNIIILHVRVPTTQTVMDPFDRFCRSIYLRFCASARPAIEPTIPVGLNAFHSGQRVHGKISFPEKTTTHFPSSRVRVDDDRVIMQCGKSNDQRRFFVSRAYSRNCD